MEEANEEKYVDEDGGWKMGTNNNANYDRGYKGLKKGPTTKWG